MRYTRVVTDDPRPSPEILLEKIRKDSRGRLKIFLGMCPGVGKTYAMLLAAQQRQEEGIRVLVGYVETHGRIETTAVAAGLPRVPRRVVRYRDSGFEEMDTDAILAAKPALVLVDELAHSNVTGGRHPKRWQDVVEILEAGIDVYTTLNVQHIESYRDVVAQITGAPAHEAVPDSLIDLADEIELIDISPAELRKRLEDGKVYLGERAVAASAGFFRDGNLRALREIALRIAAEKAGLRVARFPERAAHRRPWKAGERYLVAVGPSPFSGYLIRWTRRLCALTHGTWMAVYIDSGRSYSVEERERLDKNLALARSLGAEVLAVMGTNVARTLIRVARENNATQIVVGRPLSNPVIDLLRGGSLVDKLIRGSGEIDISVVRAEKSPPRQPFRLSAPRVARFFREIGIGALMVLGTTLFGLILNPYLGYTSVGLIYLLAILLAAFVLSRWAILFTAALTALGLGLPVHPAVLHVLHQRRARRDPVRHVFRAGARDGKLHEPVARARVRRAPPRGAGHRALSVQPRRGGEPLAARGHRARARTYRQNFRRRVVRGLPDAPRTRWTSSPENRPRTRSEPSRRGPSGRSSPRAGIPTRCRSRRACICHCKRAASTSACSVCASSVRSRSPSAS